MFAKTSVTELDRCYEVLRKIKQVREKCFSTLQRFQNICDLENFATQSNFPDLASETLFQSNSLVSRHESSRLTALCFVPKINKNFLCYESSSKFKSLLTSLFQIFLLLYVRETKDIHRWSWMKIKWHNKLRCFTQLHISLSISLFLVSTELQASLKRFEEFIDSGEARRIETENYSIKRFLSTFLVLCSISCLIHATARLCVGTHLRISDSSNVREYLLAARSRIFLVFNRHSPISTHHCFPFTTSFHK